MLVFEAVEVTLDHDIAEVVRRVVAIDERCVCEHEAEVTTAPGDGLIQPNDAVCNASDGALACESGARHVKIDAERQKKAALRRRCNLCFEFDVLHLSTHSFVVTLIIQEDNFSGVAKYLKLLSQLFLNVAVLGKDSGKLVMQLIEIR